ncbi:putative membrane protein [Klebsiella oxytoca]|nr:putative membrane protein [Klebsiella oxytoca]
MNFLLYMSIILGWVILPFGLGNSSAKETINVLTIEGSPKNKRLKKKYICMLGMSLVIILLFQNVLNSIVNILFYYICALDKLKLIYFVKPEVNLIALTFSVAGILGYKILQGSLLKEYDSLDNGL